MIYFFVFIFGIIVLFKFMGRGRFLKTETNFLFFLYILFAVLIGINAGRADYSMYLQIFKSSVIIGDSNFIDFVTSQHTQVGYNLLQAFCKTLFNTATFFFILFALIGLIFRYKFYKSFVLLQDIGIVLFAFLVHEFLRKDCVQIRNGFASAMVLYSLIYIYNGEKKIAASIILLASLFHSAALVALSILFIKKETSKRYETFLFVLLGSVVVVSVSGVFNNLIIQVLSNSKEASYYLNSNFYSSTTMSLTNPMLVKQFIISLWLILNRKKLFKDSMIFFLSQIYFLSTAYFFFFRGIEIFAARFGSLLYAVEAPLLLTLIYKSQSNIRLKRIGLWLFYFLLLIYNISAMEKFLGWRIEFN